ncbi:hypothetical protein EVAR_92883_1 [Eumeta japonica]|uniref:Uncharacterized protein n=1 Tax=Eumeta variegata TaxID=151549 RepID=A0A4C1TA87_EUMVA|nr:hypothetical protein EVAR_92883_1 [Eumeta japonica]
MARNGLKWQMLEVGTAGRDELQIVFISYKRQRNEVSDIRQLKLNFGSLDLRMSYYFTHRPPTRGRESSPVMSCVWWTRPPYSLEIHALTSEVDVNVAMNAALYYFKSKYIMSKPLGPYWASLESCAISRSDVGARHVLLSTAKLYGCLALRVLKMDRALKCALLIRTLVWEGTLIFLQSFYGDPFYIYFIITTSVFAGTYQRSHTRTTESRRSSVEESPREGATHTGASA